MGDFHHISTRYYSSTQGCPTVGSSRSSTILGNCWTSPVALIWTVLCTQKELGLQIWRGFSSWMKFWKNIFLRVFSHVDMTKSRSSALTSGQISNFREKSVFFKFFQRFRARWSTKISKIINSFDWDVDLSIIPYGTDLHDQRSSLGLSNPC